jgi:hypothetical protein
MSISNRHSDYSPIFKLISSCKWQITFTRQDLLGEKASLRLTINTIQVDFINDSRPSGVNLAFNSRPDISIRKIGLKNHKLAAETGSPLI